MRQTDAEREDRTCLAIPNSQAADGDRENFIFPVQLTTTRIGDFTRSVHILLYVMTIHTYIHTRETLPSCLWSLRKIFLHHLSPVLARDFHTANQRVYTVVALEVNDIF